MGFLKNETCRKIILFLHYNGECNFEKINLDKNKVLLTTIWNPKKLVDDNIVVKSRRAKNHQYYFIKDLSRVSKILQNSANLLLERIQTLLVAHNRLNEYFCISYKKKKNV